MPKRQFTLTPINVQVLITPGTAGAQSINSNDPDVFITAVTVRNSMDDLSEAQIGIDFKDRQGRNRLATLFPSESAGVYYAAVTINVQGAATNYSMLQKKHTLFKGYIVGYGQQDTSSGSRYVLNARGGLHLLSQLPIASLGFHPSSPHSFGLTSFSPTKQRTNPIADTANSLVAGTGDLRTGWKIFKKIYDTFSKTLDYRTAAQSGGAFKDAAFNSARKAFVTYQSPKVTEEIQSVTEIGNLDLPTPMDQKTTVLYIVYEALANQQTTFWNLLLSICQQLGLTIINLAGRTFITAFSPLGATTVNNIIPEVLTSLDLADFPFSNVTRVVLSTIKSFAPYRGELQVDDVATYPSTDSLTEQEKQTGMRTLLVSAPAFLSLIERGLVKKYCNSLLQQKNYDSMNNRNAVQEAKRVLTDIQSVNAVNYELYAKYILSVQKFKQRTGSAATCYLPNLIPGLPGTVVDPITGVTVQMLVNEVTHTLNASQATAHTHIVFSHVHYQKDVVPNPFPSPLYPANTTDVGTTILNNTGLAGVVPTF